MWGPRPHPSDPGTGRLSRLKALQAASGFSASGMSSVTGASPEAGQSPRRGLQHAELTSRVHTATPLCPFLSSVIPWALPSRACGCSWCLCSIGGLAVCSCSRTEATESALSHRGSDATAGLALVSGVHPSMQGDPRFGLAQGAVAGFHMCLCALHTDRGSEQQERVTPPHPGAVSVAYEASRWGADEGQSQDGLPGRTIFPASSA